MTKKEQLLKDSGIKDIQNLSRYLGISTCAILSVLRGEFLPTLSTYEVFKRKNLDMLAYMPDKQRDDFVRFRMNGENRTPTETPHSLIKAVAVVGDVQTLVSLSNITLSRYNQFVNGQRRISLDLAERFSEITGMDVVEFNDICNGRRFKGGVKREKKTHKGYGYLESQRPRVSYKHWNKAHGKQSNQKIY